MHGSAFKDGLYIRSMNNYTLFTAALRPSEYAALFVQVGSDLTKLGDGMQVCSNGKMRPFE